MNVSASAISDEDKYEYIIDTETNTVTITGGKGYVVEEDDGMNVFHSYIFGDVTIPTELEGFPVTEIGDYAFNECGEIDSIVIPDGIEKIGRACGSPAELYIAASVTQIAVGAFSSYCLEKIFVAEDNPKYYISQSCLVEKATKKLLLLTKDANIPSNGSVTMIPSGGLLNGRRFQKLVIPDAITDIEPHAFFGCYIGDLYIGKGITEIFSDTFYNCNVENSIVVSEENPVYHSEFDCLIESKSKTLILGCNNSRIPDDGSVEVIGYNAFSGCEKICDIMIPEAITTIESYAFSGCSNLQKISISKNVENIGTGVFDYCRNLSEINVDIENIIYHSIDNCLIATAQKRLIQGCYNSIIPDDGSVEHIGENAFYGLSNMYYLNIPEGIKTIGDSAFCSTSLVIVTLPSTLKIIQSQNFNGYGQLRYILYNGSEQERDEIKINESWSGQNNDLNSAQWYYNGEKPFENFTLSASPIECTNFIDGQKIVSHIGGRVNPLVEWFKYTINPQITVTYTDGTVLTGSEEEIENLIGFPIEVYDNQSDAYQWEIGTYTARLCCMDQTANVTVTVVDHPVEKIEIQDLTLVENEDGHYYPSPKCTVVFKDGTVKVMDTFDSYIEIMGKNIWVENNSYSLQQQSSWTPGQSYEVTGFFLDLTDTFTVTVKQKSLTNIAVISKPEKLTYTIGEALDTNGLIVAAYYDNQSVERITDYTVSGYDPTVLGEQNVKVTYNEVQTKFKVTVLPIKVTDVIIDKEEIAIITGDAITLNATVYPAEATNKSIIWRSSDPTIAKVDESGNIKALRAGRVSITATTKDSGFCVSCTVYVVCNHKNLIYKKAKKPDCINSGNSAYYMCSTCDELYKEDKITQTTEKSEKLSALGHKYSNTCDTICNVCKVTRKITHTYKTTTNKATLSKNGNIVKKCAVCGKVASNKFIKYVKTIKLSATSYTYNGKTKTPSVVIKDSAGKILKKNPDYTVKYSNNKAVGKATVTITFKGNYSGTKKLYFTINPAKTTVKSLTAGKKSLKVAITKKSTQVTGYQIQYATNKSFKSAKTKNVTSYKTTSVTLKGLSVKKTYYVRIRTYKTVKGVKYYSGWSIVKYKKTK